MVAQRSRSMDALYDDAKVVWPGIVIGWIGDPDHQTGTSGHNPDDTSGVKAELTDADTLQEVRALDFMHGSNFPATEARRLRNVLVTDPACRARLYYVIHEGKIWSRNTAWEPRTYTGSDKHNTHVHASGWAADDANTSHWVPVLALGGRVTFETDLNAYVNKYSGDLGTNPTMREIRGDWRAMINGSPDDRPVDERLTIIEKKIDAIIATLAAGGGGGGGGESAGDRTFTGTITGSVTGTSSPAPGE